ncbi:MAG TPA: hypothetical protein VFM18_19145 [Methanosarcina sp.]|nr:hypothetical protein [Methanosarcina sp.]
MPEMSNNPLAKHFRQPIIYIKLPSAGQWYPDGAIDMPVTGEVPIYAMTAKDEITIKTPDALMNGASTVQVIESCCPSIRDAWKLPIVDLDPILIAIRLATYGKDMEFTSVCPYCNTKIEKMVDLSVMLGRIKTVDWSVPIEIGELKIFLKPQSYEDFNKNNQLNFEEQQLLKVVQDPNLSESEKTEKFGYMFTKLIDTGINQVAKSILNVTTGDGVVVTEAEYIKEYLNNCDKNVWDKIKDRLTDIQSQTDYNQIEIDCENEECKKTFITPFVFEQSNFFA